MQQAGHGHRAEVAREATDRELEELTRAGLGEKLSGQLESDFFAMERSGSARSEPLSMPLKALLFEISGRRFAVALAEIEELTRACAVQALPKAPKPVLGVLNLRGAIVTVLCLRQRFGLPEKRLEPSDFFVLTRVAERRVALCVDRVLGIEELEFTQISPGGELPARIDYLSGVAAVADGVQLIYDLAQFLSQSEVVHLDRALAERVFEADR